MRNGVSDPKSLELKFLGVQGWEIRRGDDILLTGPMFSNPSFLKSGTGNISSDKAFVNCKLHKLLGDDLSKVEVLLVGHGHHDHAMDVPPTLEAIGKGVTLFANDTVRHMFKSLPTIGQVVSLEGHAVSYDDPAPDAQWWDFPNSQKPTLRILALRSEHSPQFMDFQINDAPPLCNDLRELPKNACDWRAGQPLAFLIDFLRKDDASHQDVEFRVYYADSSTLAPCGFVPKHLDHGSPRVVDVAILTGGGGQNWLPYPKNLIDNSCSVRVVVGHWENFFTRADGGDPAALSGVRELVDRLSRVRPGDACLPRPGTVYYFPPLDKPGPCVAPSVPITTERACGCTPTR
jgi:hypothetical protein